MNRRSFLQSLALAPVAAVVPVRADDVLDAIEYGEASADPWDDIVIANNTSAPIVHIGGDGAVLSITTPDRSRA